MEKREFGKKKQVCFRNDEEYYMFLGYLAKCDESTSIVWEHNEEQGAWGCEGRIQVHVQSLPFSWKIGLTAGNGGNVKYRINCNEFVDYICRNHGFICNGRQSIEKILSTIPSQYHKNFVCGLKL